MLVVAAPAANLYQQVTNDLLGRIARGVYKPGDMLPTEERLCAEYGVSRITVRRAIGDLVDRRLITRRRGVGTVVNRIDHDHRIFRLVGRLDDLLSARAKMSFKIIDNWVERSEAPIREALGVAEADSVRHIRSVVFMDKQAFTIADAYTVESPTLGVSEKDFTGRLPPAQAMEWRLGRPIERAEQRIDAVSADAVVEEHLGIARGTPMLRATRLYFTSGSRPIQYFVVRYHPDRYSFLVDLVPRAGAAYFENLPDYGTTRGKARKGTTKAKARRTQS